MSKHTPGTWQFIDNTISVRGHGIVAIVPSPQTGGVFEMQDNARLIAAAPALLKALEELYAICHGNVIATQMDQARAAIAAAKGEE